MRVCLWRNGFFFSIVSWCACNWKRNVFFIVYIVEKIIEIKTVFFFCISEWKPYTNHIFNGKSIAMDLETASKSICMSLCYIWGRYQQNSPDSQKCLWNVRSLQKSGKKGYFMFIVECSIRFLTIHSIWLQLDEFEPALCNKYWNECNSDENTKKSASSMTVICHRSNASDILCRFILLVAIHCFFLGRRQFFLICFMVIPISSHFNSFNFWKLLWQCHGVTLEQYHDPFSDRIAFKCVQLFQQS